ncbi:MAG: hypothetical protein PHP41_04805 [Bacilli bacterium]|jgi:hypothetical protein|nr:hypothetical protein [Bacilli bacterium]MDY0063698.1 hypothetical protein [Bacilli bacterium]
MKKYLIAFIITLFVMLSSSTYFIASFLVDAGSEENTVEIGQVTVLPRIYYEVDEELQPADRVEVVPGEYKDGVYLVNISNNTSDAYIENLRIHISIYSNVDTYIRVKVIEQKAITYTTSTGKTEISKLMEEPTPLNYETTNWEDRRAVDGYFYYKVKKQRVSAMTPDTVILLDSYFPDQFYASEPSNYSLQIAVIVEAVQAIGGPQANWGMENPPWGGTW